MAKVSKRLQKAREVANLDEFYTLTDAIDILNKFPAAKFDETVEVSASLGVDPKQSNQMVRGTVSLPHGSGKKVSVLVFTENPQEALDAGADFAGLDDLITKIQEGWLDFDVAVATHYSNGESTPCGSCPWTTRYDAESKVWNGDRRCGSCH